MFWVTIGSNTNLHLTLINLFSVVAGARATTHILSMKKLETILKLPLIKIKVTFQQINIIATQYAHSILVHKQRLENGQCITNLQDLE